ncbi:MAG: ABC transporter permease [Oscillospiraceae bacterium]
MKRRLLTRLISMVITLIGVSIIAFTLVRLTPGNPAELMLPDDASEEQIAAQERKMGLDKPVIVQYFTYMAGVLKGDLGYSYKFNMEVSKLIALRFPQTAKLAGVTLSWMLVFSITLGVVAGINKGKGIDVFSMIFALFGQAVAPVWLSLMMILFFAVKLKWLPTGGVGGLKYMIMPSLCQGLQSSAIVSRMTRTGMVDVLQEDYITAMRARGVSKIKIYTVYALKNAILSTVTTIGNQIAHLLAGAAVIESIFSWPGMGQLLIQAIGYRDLQLVQSLLMVSALIIAVTNLVVDFVYTLVDPRISFN